MAHWLAVQTLPEEPSWYVNLDTITDFNYDPQRNKTIVSFLGEEKGRIFDGDITQQFINALAEEIKRTNENNNT